MNQGFSLSLTAKKMMAGVGILFVLLLAAGLAVICFIYPFEQPLPYLAGLAIGCALSLLKCWMLDKSLNHAVDMEQKYAAAYYVFQYLLRYCATGIVIVAVILMKG